MLQFVSEAMSTEQLWQEMHRYQVRNDRFLSLLRSSAQIVITRHACAGLLITVIPHMIVRCTAFNKV